MSLLKQLCRKSANEPHNIPSNISNWKWNRRVFIKLQHYIVTKQPCCFVERGTPPRHSFRESRDRYKVLHCNAYFNVYAFAGNVNDCFLIFCLSCNRQLPRHKSWKCLCFLSNYKQIFLWEKIDKVVWNFVSILFIVCIWSKVPDSVIKDSFLLHLFKPKK